eukprot:8752496-Pyramimonas_sp.AAC.1
MLRAITERDPAAKRGKRRSMRATLIEKEQGGEDAQGWRAEARGESLNANLTASGTKTDRAAVVALRDEMGKNNI